MRIAIVAPSSVPYVLGGAERLWEGLKSTIQQHTPHDAELIKLPVREFDLPNLVAAYRAFWQLDLSHFDLVVSSKYPAWMVRHPNHVVYLQHTLRGLYDTYPAEFPTRVDESLPGVRQLMDIARSDPRGERNDELFAAAQRLVEDVGPGHPVLGFPGPLARALVHHLDATALHPANMRRHLAISATVAARPGYFPAGVDVRVLHHPSNLEGLHGGDYEYLFTASRLDEPKRVDLIVAAMQSLPAHARLRIAGVGPQEQRLRALAAGDPRIEFLGYVTEAQLAELYAGALSVLFVPQDEDLGLITLEAFSCAKPVITCVDSGGATELVQQDVSGAIVEATPAAIARAARTLLDDPELARRMGRAGRRTAERVTWTATVQGIIGDALSLPHPPPRSRGRRRVVVVSTFPVHPRLGGGQLRCAHLYGQLADPFDVEMVSLAPPNDAPRLVELAPGVYETVVPVSRDHERGEWQPTAAVGVPISDILTPSLVWRTPQYVEALARASVDASAVVLAHPFLYPAVKEVAPQLPVVYDAHNVEILLKEAVLPSGEMARLLLDSVRDVEGAACRDAAVVTACSEEDRESLARIYGVDPARITVIPNGVDVHALPFREWGLRQAARTRWIEAFRRAGGPDAARWLAAFVGSWHPPNIGAARLAIDLAARRPDVVVALVGGVCEVFREWQLPPNVALLGSVRTATKDAILAAADVALNPMLQGSGTNLKTLEYMAAGVPVVSSPTGVRGLPVRDGGEVVVVPPERLDLGVARILDDPDGAREIALRARRLVEEGYDWAILGARFRDAVERAAGSPSPAGYDAAPHARRAGGRTAVGR